MSSASAPPSAYTSPARATLSISIITCNEEANLGRALASVASADELVIVDSGSVDATAEIAASYNARFYLEAWQGFGRQKNFALDKCSSDWVLSLDADEEVSQALALEIQSLLRDSAAHAAWFVPRRNHFLGRPLSHGGYYPDRKLRLVRRGAARFEERSVHETLQYSGTTGLLRGELMHHAYPTLHEYIEHMDRYSGLGAARLIERRGHPGFLRGVVFNPILTFLYNYVLRAGFLDGREGLLMHLYHSVYVSWKYAKAWERGRTTLRS